MKTKTTKRAMLTSVLCLLLCVAMLIGTTYAWFTDSVTSGSNVIQSGNLDVELEYWDGAKFAPVTASTKIFNDDARWEPGYTEVAYLKVSNLGSLALQYKLNINVLEEIAGKTKSGAAINLSDHLVFKVIEIDEAAVDTYTRETAMKAAGAELGLTAFNGNAKPLDPKGGANDEDYVALIVYMPTTVGNEANHDGVNIPSIKMNASLFATQLEQESDSFGANYDAAATYPAGDAAAKVELEELTLSAEEVDVVVPASAANGAYELIVSNKDVAETAEGTVVSYDIDLLKDGVKVAASGEKYLVKIDIGAGRPAIKKVLHKGEAVTDYTYDFATGIISFETASFSPFSVTFEEPVIKWDGEVAEGDKDELKSLYVDEQAKTIYVSGAEGFVALNTLAADWASYVDGYNAYYYKWQWKVVLLSDVDLQNKPFSGINFIWNGIDGNGHTISNVYMEGQGIFAQVAEGEAYIKDLNVKDIFIDGNTYDYVGAVAGTVRGTLTNVHASNVTVKGDKYVGGLTGKATGPVAGCSVKNSTISLSNNAEKTIGGLVGYMIIDGVTKNETFYVVDNTVADTEVIGTYNVGGLFGQLQGGTDAVVAEGNTVARVNVISTDALPANASSNEKRADAVAARVVDDAVVGANTIIDVNVEEVVANATADVPKAVVTQHPEYENVDISWDYLVYGEAAQLNAVYSFQPEQSVADAAASKYATWHTDFRVSINRDIEEGEIFLGGNYGSFGWIGFENPERVDAGVQVPLLAYFTGNETSNWEYQDIVSQVQDFCCGVGATAAGAEKLDGATFTVELILTNPEDHNEVIVVNKTTYTF